MTAIAQNLQRLRSQLLPSVKLVAVSKFHPIPALIQAYEAGQRIFGESRVQELQQKVGEMPADVEWHFIGHLQPNKVKYIAPYVSLIHAVDTPKLLAEIDKQGRRVGRRIRCLLQVHVAREETKFGFLPDELLEFMRSGQWCEHEWAQICGMMCMATNTDDMQRVSADFEQAHKLFLQIKRDFFAADEHFRECSWGMSHDFEEAMQHGATLVRIGTDIFGEREY